MPFVVHPNPFFERFEITSGRNLNPKQIRLYDLKGNDLSSYLTISNESPIVVIADELPNGVYLLEMTDQYGAKQAQKVVKR